MSSHRFTACWRHWPGAVRKLTADASAVSKVRITVPMGWGMRIELHRHTRCPAYCPFAYQVWFPQNVPALVEAEGNRGAAEQGGQLVRRILKDREREPDPCYRRGSICDCGRSELLDLVDVCLVSGRGGRIRCLESQHDVELAHLGPVLDGYRERWTQPPDPPGVRRKPRKGSAQTELLGGE